MDEGRNMILMFPGIIDFGSPEHKKAFDPQYVFFLFLSSRTIISPFPSNDDDNYGGVDGGGGW